VQDLRGNLLMSSQDVTAMKIPGYTIERQIGQGGMAMVYYAIQESLGRPVALKVMNPLFADSAEFSQRFVNEGRMLAAARHSHIVTIYDIGISDTGLHYISMEYVDGGDLQQRIRHGLPPETALEYVITLSSCLTTAHAVRIVHRDIKPVNILFRHDGTLLLTDFGVAKQLTTIEELTATGNMVGSPHYLSPEQALGRPIDGRSDIYSLGIVLYEMLVGVRPFEGSSAIDVALKHINSPLPRLPHGLEHFEPLLEKMTAKNPDNRFRDAASLGQAAQHLHDIGVWHDSRASMSTFATQAASPPSAGRQGPLGEGETSERTIVDRTTLVGLAETVILPAQDRPEATSYVRGSKHWRLIALAGGLTLAMVIGIVMAIGGRPAERDALGPPALIPSTPAQPTAAVPSVSAIPPEPITFPQPPMESAPPTMAGAPAPDTVPIQPVEAVPPLQQDQDAPAPFRDQEQIDALLHTAQAALADTRLALPADNSAYYYYQKVLELDPDNSQARDGVMHIAERYLALAQKAVEKGQYMKAKHYVQLGLSVQSEHPDLVSLDSRLKGLEKKSAPSSQRVTQQGPTEQREPATRRASQKAPAEPSTPLHKIGNSVEKAFRDIKNFFH
jgi:serine/threonine-protein kinase PpkA